MKSSTAFVLPIFFYLLCLQNAQAQVLIAPFQNRMVLNPSMIDHDGGGLRIGHRIDWTGIPGNYSSSYGVVGIEKQQHAFGAVWSSESAGVTPFKQQKMTIVYAYDVQLSDSAQLKLGLSSGFANYSLGSGAFIFGDQLDINRGILSNTNEELDQQQRSVVPVLKTGLTYQTNNWWIGTSYHRYLGRLTYVDIATAIPSVFLMHAGAKVLLNESIVNKQQSSILLFPEWSALYTANFLTMSIGGNFVFDHLYGQNGLFFTGVHYERALADQSNSGLAFTLGIEQQKMRFSYHYSIGFQKFVGGGHEFTASLFFNEVFRRNNAYL